MFNNACTRYIGCWTAITQIFSCDDAVERNVDVDAIQLWLMSDEADVYVEQRQFFSGELQDKLPGFVTDFNPKHIAFYGSESDEERSVKFEWGGALGHWGFVVGLPTMKAKLKGSFHLGGSEIETRRSVRPGVYVYIAG